MCETLQRDNYPITNKGKSLRLTKVYVHVMLLESEHRFKPFSATFFFFPPEVAVVSFDLGVNSALRGELATRGALSRWKWQCNQLCVMLGFFGGQASLQWLQIPSSYLDKTEIV